MHPAALTSARRDPRPARERPLETEYRPRHPLDLMRTVSIQQRGAHDPTFSVAASVIWRASRTPAGIATLALREISPSVIRAAAWGPGREQALAQVPALCGADDELEGFDASRHPLVAQTHRRHPGLRLSRTDGVFDALAGAILEQKVTGIQAFGAWRRLVTWCGERAPGPTPVPMFAPPTIDGWRGIPSWTWHRAGVEPPQARAVIEAARRGPSLVHAVTAAADGEGRDAALTGVRGIGAWTAAETRARALGDPDAVSVGDYHLAHEVGFALTGARTDDDGMLRLLSAWPGHRQRVIRLIRLSPAREPRRGPRLHPEDHRDR
ncbi:DNA-3-methyladenine glycosylase 2 family protein [Microbacterium protaetiae]|uniref:DNA-3-methyladenine glycosylase 2 family protein n=1 Tax=Microbacterium protaetiae TaxID=2509458 RepID=A0A4P6EGS2_9MICO|nr:DNA-3-methyladenine glycosylase 2 family protein [Microbacterium protaetiae]QAY60369.1 DNA-3-methyladenine glycosylase 2 family protein [Microbacterium protaetiae]